MNNEPPSDENNKINHLEKTPWDNLIDMLWGEFDQSGLSNSEIMQICTDCLEEANCPYCFMRIAEIFTDISEYSLAEETYKKAELLVVEAYDYIYLARSIIDNFNLSWGMSILSKGIMLTDLKPNYCDYSIIASVFACEVGDTLSAIKFYKIAESYAVSKHDFEFIANDVLEYLEDEFWYAELIEKSKQIPEIQYNLN